MKPWVRYSLVRLAIFAVALVILMLIGVEPVLSTVIAAVLGLCVAYIFFGRLRSAVAADLAARRASAGPPKDADAAAEDAEVG